MKKSLHYKFGIIAMCFLIALSIILLANTGWIFYDELSWWKMLFPIFGFVVVPIVGLILYVKKKDLGWLLCCGYVIFILLFLCGAGCVYLVMFNDGNGPLFVDFCEFLLAFSVLFALVRLFMSKQLQSEFYEIEQECLRNKVVESLFTALGIGFVVFIPVIISVIIHRMLRSVGFYMVIIFIIGRLLTKSDK